MKVVAYWIDNSGAYCGCDDGRVFVLEAATWRQTIGPLQPVAADPPTPAPKPDPTPAPHDPRDLLLTGIELTPREHALTFDVSFPNGFDLYANGRIPEDHIGKEREIYLFGFDDGFQIFARTKNRYLCAGAPSPDHPTLKRLASIFGEPIETQPSGWSSAKLNRIAPAGGFTLDQSITSAFTGKLFVGEDKPIKPGDTKTTLPIGVIFDTLQFDAL